QVLLLPGVAALVVRHLEQPVGEQLLDGEHAVRHRCPPHATPVVVTARSRRCAPAPAGTAARSRNTPSGRPAPTPPGSGRPRPSPTPGLRPRPRACFVATRRSGPASSAGYSHPVASAADTPGRRCPLRPRTRSPRATWWLALRG